MNRSIRWLVLLVVLPVVPGGMYVPCLTQAEQPPAGSKEEDDQPAAKPKPQSIDELLLFFPAKHPAGDWEPAGLEFEDAWFEADDKTRLHGWYCPVAKPRAVVLIAHGNAVNVASRGPWLKYLQSTMRVSTLMFDYRGYGRSEGVPTVEGVLADARSARTELARLAGVDQSQLLLMGESLGGAVAVQLAAESAPRGLILQSTFSSLKDVAQVHYPKLAWLVPEAKLNSVSAISQYEGPLLVSHGRADRTIPFNLGRKLFDAGHDPKQFVRIRNADHNDWLTREYLRQLDQFIDEVAQQKK